MSDLDISSRVRLGKLKLILNNNVFSSLGNLGAAILITLILSLHFDSFQLEVIIIWLAVMLVATLFRIIVGARLIHLYEQARYHKVLSNRFYYPVILTHAFMWACLPIVFIRPGELLINSFIAGTIAGISAGALSSLAPVKQYYFSFIIITLLPTTVMFVSLGEMESWLFGFLIFLFLGYMIRSGNMFSNTIENNLTLNFKNEVLISALKDQTEKALEGNRLKSEFLANMSHEIRTPMNGIIGFIQLLLGDEKDSGKRKYLETIDRSSQDLLRIINDILDFSKIESNQLQLEFSATDLTLELQESVDLYQERARNNQVIIELIVESDIPKILNLDGLRMRQVIHNLLSNAIKFSNPNSKVFLKARYQEDKSNLIVRVEDKGIGIAEEKLTTIFEPFIQEDTSVTRKYGGTGLGLAISYRLSELMGGSLTVQSEKGNGTVFELTLPVSEIAMSDVAEIPKKLPLDRKLTGHILLVEDNPVNQLLLKKILDSRGLSYELASDGVEALDRFQNAQYDLILMDINMPRLSGEEATVAIRDLEKQQNLSPTPIVALTANAMQGDKEKFLSYGMDEYLTKPIRIEAFDEMLRKFLVSH